MAIDIASSYLLSKARLHLADLEMEKMQNKGNPAELADRMADLLTIGKGDFEDQL